MKSITVNGKELLYVVQRKSVKNVNMRMKDDGIVYISANNSVPDEYITALIEKYALKFLKQLDTLEEKHKTDVDISVTKYLGNEYPVEVIKSENENIIFDDEKFMVYTPDTENKDKILSAILNWKSDRCMDIFSDMNMKVCEEFRNSGFTVPLSIVTIKYMKSRWGSCNYVSGRFSMNLRLIDYPIECIHAVFCHEYMHYIHQNHSDKFYKDLEKICPFYKKYDKVLK